MPQILLSTFRYGKFKVNGKQSRCRKESTTLQQGFSIRVLQTYVIAKESLQLLYKSPSIPNALLTPSYVTILLIFPHPWLSLSAKTYTLFLPPPALSPYLHTGHLLLIFISSYYKHLLLPHSSSNTLLCPLKQCHPSRNTHSIIWSLPSHQTPSLPSLLIPSLSYFHVTPSCNLQEPADSYRAAPVNTRHLLFLSNSFFLHFS